MTHEVRIAYTDVPSEVWEVDGWAIGDPPGFLQLLEATRVYFVPLARISMIEVPRLDDPVET